MPRLTLEAVLDSKTQEGRLYEKLPGNKLRCFACGHTCIIPEGKRGICRVRYNREGTLRVPYGYVSSIQSDPVEKKPFFHLLPGSRALTFGMLGCDFHCPYCQNWDISQALRDPEAGALPTDMTPEKIIAIAKQAGALSVVSSYNEPLITSEWAVDIFRVAKKNGLKTAFVSNGNGTPEALNFIRPYTDCFKVDLKGMREESYRMLGGKLSVVLKTIEQLAEMKFWVEVVTLVIPGFNDSEKELKEMAEFIASVSPGIPWHLTAFHRDYHMMNSNNTSQLMLLRAAKIGREAGLNFVYAGNLPGQVENYENSYCPSCKAVLIERDGYSILKKNIGPDGQCPSCRTRIPGVWE